jgi:hypothetical protein
MTPQQIADYKLKWMPGYSVGLHSDLMDAAKVWCKRQVPKESWSCSTWTNVYEHTFHFEHIEAAQNFEIEFGGFANVN